MEHKVKVLYALVTGRRNEECFRIELIEEGGNVYGLFWIFDDGKAIGFDIDDVDEIDKMIKALSELKKKLEGA